jgi:hypothetical protein
VAVESVLDDTRLRLDLEEAVPGDGAVLDLSLVFSFEIPEYGAGRMGRLDVAGGPIYQIAQWYPRLAVFDADAGWSTMPYLGQGEFYLEQGDFDVSLTVPGDFLVVATGTWSNPDEVFTEEQQRRLEDARASDASVAIVRADEVGSPESRPDPRQPLTWRFHADGVRDFAWAASPAFRVDAAGWNNVLLVAAYPAEAAGDERGKGWEDAIAALRDAVSSGTARWADYPYPMAAAAAGRVGSAGSPMLAFASFDARGEGLRATLAHETAHAWWPGLVGSDERRHAWMDEGFAAFASRYEAEPASAFHADSMAAALRRFAGLPPTTAPADALPREAVDFLHRGKPAFGLHLLRSYILDADTFDTAMRRFLAHWSGRHPRPADFFASFNETTAEDLSWFWEGWFGGASLYDPRWEEGAGFLVHQPAGAILPLDIRFDFADGTTMTQRIPAERFLAGAPAPVDPGRTDVRNAVIDPLHLLPDTDRTNNRWPR